MKKNGRCPAGQYYCYTNKECKPIPAGFMVDPEGMLRKENGASIDEAGSLHHWFKGSKSKEGKPGWVNVVTGGTCASDKPGEGTPKCVSSSKRASMTAAERRSAARRKKAADPGQQQKTGAAKPTYVSTDKPKKKMNESQERDHEYSMARSELSTIMSAAKRLKSKMGKGEGNIEAWVQSKITKAADYLDSAADYVDSGEMKVKEEFIILPLEIEIPTNLRDFNLGLMFRESLDFNKGMLFVFDEVGQKSFHMTETKIPLDIAFITEEGYIDSIKQLEPFEETPVSSDGEVLKALEVNRGWFAENNVEVGDEIQIVLDEAQKDVKGKGSGSKDACYHKVKSRYSVWPSAYASGALVKCRKAGAANWGNKSEETNYELDEKCWSGYEKKGMKTMFGKRYPNCVKKKVSEAVRIPPQNGNIVFVHATWRGKYYAIRMFFPQTSLPKRADVQQQIDKVYPGAKVQSFQVSDYVPGQPLLQVTEGAAWTRKEGQNKSGGLNEKGRKSYERENPGSDLKAPSKKVGNKRRASFCARMKGMKKKLTSAKTASDPNSRINKSLRAWNC